MNAHDIARLKEDVMRGQRRALAKAITLLEDSRPNRRADAEKLLMDLIPLSGKSVRVGISGTPGVGKSTFIETLGAKLVADGHRLAVLAVDPSSPHSGGSILGDRVRMEELSKHADVFIRPSPSGATLGGVNRHTREAIIACEAAGYDIVLVETVGVGQSEIAAASMTDVFLLLQLPNAGDEMQGIKRGILEIADVLAITKADGHMLADAKVAKAHLGRALAMVRHDTMPPVVLISSKENRGLDELWEEITKFVDRQRADGSFEQRRQDQALAWFKQEIPEALIERLHQRTDLHAAYVAAEQKIRTGGVVASIEAGKLLDQILIPQNSSR